MKRQLFFLTIALFTFVTFSGCRGEHEVVVETEVIQNKAISSDKLTETSFVSNMREKIEKGKNTIYCSTSQLAWNKLKEYAEGDLAFTEPFEEADRLNTSPFKSSYIDDNSCVSEVGKVSEGIVEKINNQLKLKFPDLNHTYKPDSPVGDGIISYAFLYKNLQFAKEFEKLEDGMSFHQNADKSIKVKGFGFDKYDFKKNQELRDQVEVLKLTHESTVVKLSTKSEDDDLILAMIEPGKDLIETYQKVVEIEKNAKAADNDYIKYLRIPVIDFNITHSYEQFLNKSFTNQKLEGYFIAEARQDIEFKLNEKGAVLKSEYEYYLLKVASDAPEGVEFNRPFLVIMRKKGAELPYFMCWVANTELLKAK